MERARRWWEAGVARSRALRLLDAQLRGAAQVMLQERPLSGFCFLAAIGWGGPAEGRPGLLVAALLGLATATATGRLLGGERTALQQGLFGFNGLLVGVAVPSFLVMHPASWVLLVLGAAASSVVLLALRRLLAIWGVPPLTAPFVLVSCGLILAAYAFGHLPLRDLPAPSLSSAAAAAQPAVTHLYLLKAVVRGLAQVFLMNDLVAGLLVLAGLLLASAWAAAFALAGSAVALATALLMGADPAQIDAGLYGFSPVLTAIALGCIFARPGWRSAGLALLATVLTVVAQGALNAAVTPLGIPGFTAAFVLVTWLFLLARPERGSAGA